MVVNLLKMRRKVIQRKKKGALKGKQRETSLLKLMIYDM